GPRARRPLPRGQRGRPPRGRQRGHRQDHHPVRPPGGRPDRQGAQVPRGENEGGSRAMKKLPAPKTVAEIAALLGGAATGDTAAVITAVAEVASAGPSDVASFHNMKYVAAAQASPAGCLLVPEEIGRAHV